MNAHACCWGSEGVTDWRTLPAGPELDAIVAARVFGWESQGQAAPTFSTTWWGGASILRDRMWSMGLAYNGFGLGDSLEDMCFHMCRSALAGLEPK